MAYLKKLNRQALEIDELSSQTILEVIRHTIYRVCISLYESIQCITGVKQD